MSSSSSGVRVAAEPVERTGWRAAALLGLMLAGAGLVVSVMELLPASLMDPNWEIGAISAFLDSLPLPAIGLGLLVGAGVALGRRVQVWVAGVTFVVLALLIIIGAMLYATDIPLAFQVVSGPEFLSALKKAMAKTAVQVVVYPVAFIWAAISAFRRVGQPSLAAP